MFKFTNFLRNHWLSLFLLIGFFLFYFFGGVSSLANTSIFTNISETAILVTSSFIHFVLSILGFNPIYNFQEQTLYLADTIVSIASNVGVKFYLMLLCVIFIFPRDWKNSIRIFLIAFFFLFLLTSSNIIGLMFLSQPNAYIVSKLSFYFKFLLIFSCILLNIFTKKQIIQFYKDVNLFLHKHMGVSFIACLFFTPFIYIYVNHSSWVFYIWILIVISIYLFSIKNNSLNHVYSRLNERLTERFNITIFGLLLVVPILLNLNLLIDAFYAYHLNANWLLTTILNLSKYFLSIFGYIQTEIVGRSLFLESNYVRVWAPCLGIGIMTSFSILVLLIRSPWINKLLYILFGLGVIILMNSVRIVYLLIHLHKHQSYQLAMDAHDLSNYFFYIVVFLLFLGYILWFQYVPLFRGKVER